MRVPALGQGRGKIRSTAVEDGDVRLLVPFAAEIEELLAGIEGLLVNVALVDGGDDVDGEGLFDFAGEALDIDAKLDVADQLAIVDPRLDVA